jgi:aconitate hydratase
MPQKILAGRAADPQLRGDLVQVKVDQVVLSRAPARALAEALAHGLKKTPVEVAVAYDGTCVTDATSLREAEERGPRSTPPDFPSYGVQIARPGIGFPAPVPFERFAAPARLALTDDPRLATVGGVGMLALVASAPMLGQALATGSVWLRPPRSVQIHLGGRVRPFVCARDVALELLRRGIDQIVRRIEAEHHAPVVLEFAGPSARLLSVQERSVLAGVAPQLGAAAAIFVSDEKTEVFLRDQRRSKAHRAIVPDPGAPCEEVLSIDLSTVDPLLLDEDGHVRPVRDLAGKPVSQVMLGGDSGTTLRDMLAAAMLLKSKRVPSRLDLLVSPPSRQVLEVLAQSGALVDLVATGARIIEPDARIVSSEVYPPPRPGGGLSMRTQDPEPRTDGSPRFIVASAETLAYAVATGSVGDPRSFKRPVRVTVPRALPTDDVLVLRDKKGDALGTKKSPTTPVREPIKDTLTLEVLETPAVPPGRKPTGDGFALLLGTLDDVRLAAERPLDREGVRVVIAAFVPSQAVTALAAEAVVAFSIDDAALKSVKGSRQVSIPAPSKWGDAAKADGVTATFAAPSGKDAAGKDAPAKGKGATVALVPLTRGAEAGWSTGGGLKPTPKK